MVILKNRPTIPNIALTFCCNQQQSQGGSNYMIYIYKLIEMHENDFLGRSKFATDLVKAISSYKEVLYD